MTKQVASVFVAPAADVTIEDIWAVDLLDMLIEPPLFGETPSTHCTMVYRAV